MEHDLETDLAIRDVDNAYLRDIQRASEPDYRERVVHSNACAPRGVLAMLCNPELRPKPLVEAREKQTQR